MLKIEKRSETGRAVTYALSGKLGAAHRAALSKILEASRAAGQQVTFDLEGVGLVDREIAEYFSRGEGSRAKLVHPPTFLREWLAEAAKKL